MNPRQFFLGRAIGFLVVLVLAVVGFYVFNSYIYNEKQGEPQLNQQENFEPQRMTLSGKFVCLPHRDTSGPQTLECAHGLLANNGMYYALDFNLMSQTQPNFVAGQEITAGGVFTPIERLSTDHWSKYNMVGIFSVTDISGL